MMFVVFEALERARAKASAGTRKIEDCASSRAAIDLSSMIETNEGYTDNCARS